jgi:hypothetical protein
VPTVTEGSEGEASVSVVGLTRIAAVADLVCAGLLLSVTVTVKVEDPLAVGVPAIIPVDDARVTPAGRLPELIDQV